ncbi:MAG: aldo/keto reductase [Dokdonella sp.]|uniref:aldo/keto reductase n=1 Tax=Dokdonella sp. TaxID=2291710 RepID=UPI003267AC4E
MSLRNYRSLGRSGLVVSPLALGTMTFGTERWGSDEAASREIFDAYVDAGGNFIDTVDVYADGRSEEMVGQFIADRGLRDQMVVATKAGFASGQGLHAGGNGARHLHASIERSLGRLRTNHIDLFWLHVWDSVTPAEEILETMTTLVRSGKVRYWGVSNAPAWFVAKLATLAAVRGTVAPIALQYFYSLVNRDVEDEHLVVANEFGMGFVPWSPLAFGLLTGKYNRSVVEAGDPRASGLPRDAAVSGAMRPADDKRLNGANPFGDSLFTERNWHIVEVVKTIAVELGQSPSRVALSWVTGRPGISSTLMGASRSVQVVDNIGALSLALSPDHLAALEAASANDPRMLYRLFQPEMRQHAIFGGAAVRPWRQ